MVTETEKAYIAGYVDADGSIGIHRRSSGKQLTPRLQISSTKLESLLWINGKFPGHIYSSKKKTKTTSQQYLLCYNSRKARGILEAIHPYLVLKNLQCGLVLEFLDTIVDNMHRRAGLSPEVEELRELYALECELLNEKGR